jgi:Fe2+ transport system protein FeoA
MDGRAIILLSFIFAHLEALSIPVESKKREIPALPLDKDFGPAHTEIKMQLSVNCEQPEPLPASLMDLRRGDAAILDRIDLPVDDARRLMELGFLPGTQIVAGRSAPGGDPQVFQVDGSEIALRRETAKRLKVRHKKATKPDRSARG